MAAKADTKIHAVDRHVGLAIRTRRKLAKRSQSWLAEKLGITFQQIQKYERGANRVSASALFEIAQALETSVGSFFAGLEGAADKTSFLADDAVIHQAALDVPAIRKIPNLPKHSRVALGNVINALAA